MLLGRVIAVFVEVVQKTKVHCVESEFLNVKAVSAVL